jgi:hypothetical protein
MTRNHSKLLDSDQLLDSDHREQLGDIRSTYICDKTKNLLACSPPIMSLCLAVVHDAFVRSTRAHTRASVRVARSAATKYSV